MSTLDPFATSGDDGVSSKSSAIHTRRCLAASDRRGGLIGLVGDDLLRLENQPAFTGLGAHHRLVVQPAAQELLRERILEVLLDRSAQRPRAVG